MDPKKKKIKDLISHLKTEIAAKMEKLWVPVFTSVLSIHGNK